jgi:hypothetical protein
VVKEDNNNSELESKDDDEVTIQHIEDVRAKQKQRIFY